MVKVFHRTSSQVKLLWYCTPQNRVRYDIFWRNVGDAGDDRSILLLMNIHIIHRTELAGGGRFWKFLIWSLLICKELINYRQTLLWWRNDILLQLLHIKGDVTPPPSLKLHQGETCVKFLTWKFTKFYMVFVCPNVLWKLACHRVNNKRPMESS